MDFQSFKTAVLEDIVGVADSILYEYGYFPPLLVTLDKEGATANHELQEVFIDNEEDQERILRYFKSLVITQRLVTLCLILQANLVQADRDEGKEVLMLEFQSKGDAPQTVIVPLALENEQVEAQWSKTFTVPELYSSFEVFKRKTEVATEASS